MVLRLVSKIKTFAWLVCFGSSLSNNVKSQTTIYLLSFSQFLINSGKLEGYKLERTNNKLYEAQAELKYLVGGAAEDPLEAAEINELNDEVAPADLIVGKKYFVKQCDNFSAISEEIEST